MDILPILLTKSINLHYSTRYISFINACRAKQENNLRYYTEKHHILPRAKTFFPEFSNLKINMWNKIHLTPRQHFIAHWLLWKALGGSMAFAFLGMKRKSKYQTERYFLINSKTYEKLKIEVALQQSKRIVSDETRAKMSCGQKNQSKIKCPHCGKEGNAANMRRWHFENCKNITGIQKHKINTTKEIIKCPHCGKEGNLLGMKSNHFDNCPKIKDRSIHAEIIKCPHCGKEGKDTKSFKHHHFDNCKKLTGISASSWPKNTEIIKCPHCGKEGNVRGIKAKHFDRCPAINPKINKIKCPHCGKEGNDNNYFKTYHFDKCKSKINP